MKRFHALFLAALFATPANLTAAEWTRFRGPHGGVSDATNLPTQWSAQKNIVWQTDLPGLGSSSPVETAGRVFLTCYTGYGVDESEPGDMDALRRYVVCLDRKDGKILWSKEVAPKLPVGRYEGNGARHGYSTSTPVTDGERLYVFFGATGVFCFDLDGKQLWTKDVGDGTHNWGSAASPVLYQGLLIVNASVESKSIFARDKRTGEEVWRVDGIKGAWNTPTFVELPGGSQEMVVCVPQKILGLDPATGKELWQCEGIPDRGYVCPSVVAHKDVVYAIGGRQNTAIAVRAGGRGDVTDTHELWRTGKGSNVSSPVYHEGHIYWVHEGKGVAYCLNAETGEVVFEERLSPRPGTVYASVMVGDGKLYAVSQHNGVYVFAAKPEYELVAHNEIEHDDSRANAGVVVSGNQLLLRTNQRLYCIGQ